MDTKQSGTFDRLRFYKFTFTLKVTETIVFPFSFKGLLLRNAIKNVFVKEFEAGIVNEIFESRISKETAEKLGIGSHPPRGYIIEDDTAPKLKYLPGDVIYFNLILIGDTIRYINMFIDAVLLLAKKYWLGRKSGFGRGSFALESVTLNGEAVYDKEKEKLTLNSFAPLSIEYLNFDNSYKRLIINFITPTCIVPENDVKPILINRTGDIKLFMLMLYRRLLHLQYLYCGNKEFTIDKLIHDTIKITGADLENHIFRIGNEKFEGFTGAIEIEGIKREYVPLFLLGEQLHAGKDCSYGFGKYEILN